MPCRAMPCHATHGRDPYLLFMVFYDLVQLWQMVGIIAHAYFWLVVYVQYAVQPAVVLVLYPPPEFCSVLFSCLPCRLALVPLSETRDGIRQMSYREMNSNACTTEKPTPA